MAEPAPELRTGRLTLRQWRAEDRAPFAALNADHRVAEMLSGPLSRSESDALADRLEAGLNEAPFGGWVVEAPGLASFVGMVGLDTVGPEFPFAPAVEVGWRLDPAFWGQGFATEAASVALAYGFNHCGLAEVLAFTAAVNQRSRAVMERLAMVRDRDGDFFHPRLSSSSRLQPHVLYRSRTVAAPAFEVVVSSPGRPPRS